MLPACVVSCAIGSAVGLLRPILASSLRFHQPLRPGDWCYLDAQPTIAADHLLYHTKAAQATAPRRQSTKVRGPKPALQCEVRGPEPASSAAAAGSQGLTWLGVDLNPCSSARCAISPVRDGRGCPTGHLAAGQVRLAPIFQSQESLMSCNWLQC